MRIAEQGSPIEVRVWRTSERLAPSARDAAQARLLLRRGGELQAGLGGRDAQARAGWGDEAGLRRGTRIRARIRWSGVWWSGIRRSSVGRARVGSCVGVFGSSCGRGCFGALGGLRSGWHRHVETRARRRLVSTRDDAETGDRGDDEDGSALEDRGSVFAVFVVR